MTRKTLQEIIDANPEAETFRFGDSEALSRQILALVREGKKTATVEAMRVYRGKGADVLPAVGRRDVALEWDGRPALMVETVEVRVRRFDEMDEAFVALQGQFRDLEHWRKAYRAYFSRNGGVSEDMEIMCERFRVVEDYAVPDAPAPAGKSASVATARSATGTRPGRGLADGPGRGPGKTPGNGPGQGPRPGPGGGTGKGPSKAQNKASGRTTARSQATEKGKR